MKCSWSYEPFRSLTQHSSLSICECQETPRAGGAAKYVGPNGPSPEGGFGPQGGVRPWGGRGSASLTALSLSKGRSPLLLRCYPHVVDGLGFAINACLYTQFAYIITQDAYACRH